MAVAGSLPRRVVIERAFMGLFITLNEHRKVSEGEVADIYAAIVAQVRSACPQALMSLDSSPFTRVDPEPSEPAPAAAIERVIGDASYRLSADGGCVVMFLDDAMMNADLTSAIVAFLPEQVDVLVADLAAVKLAAMGGGR